MELNFHKHSYVCSRDKFGFKFVDFNIGRKRGGETNIVSWREIVSQISVKKVMKWRGEGCKDLCDIVQCQVERREREKKSFLFILLCGINS
jgi:hypothetical protein